MFGGAGPGVFWLHSPAEVGSAEGLVSCPVSDPPSIAVQAALKLNVLVTTSPATGRRFILKQLPLMDPSDPEDRRALDILVARARCCGFPRLVGWSKTAGPLRTSDPEGPRIVVAMEDAGQTLHTARATLGLGLLRSVVFQVLFALRVAQQDVGFCHNDLHGRNVLVGPLRVPELSPTQPTHAALHALGRTWYCPSSHVATIVDFGISRCKLPDVGGGCARPWTGAFAGSSAALRDAASVAEVLVARRDWPIGERRAVGALRKTLEGGAPLGAVLEHRFFEALTVVPLSSAGVVLAHYGDRSTLGPPAQDRGGPMERLLQRSSSAAMQLALETKEAEHKQALEAKDALFRQPLLQQVSEYEAYLSTARQQVGQANSMTKLWADQAAEQARAHPKKLDELIAGHKLQPPSEPHSVTTPDPKGTPQ
eukprot:m51a1_g8090 hypothetical protein (424) ;mRNA; f:49192-51454